MFARLFHKSFSPSSSGSRWAVLGTGLGPDLLLIGFCILGLSLYLYFVLMRLLSDIAGKQLRLLRLLLPFCSLCVCVCLSVTFVHCAQTTEDITTIFAHDSYCHSQIVLKIDLHWSTPSSTNFALKWPTPVDFSCGDIRRQIAARWLDSTVVTMDSPYRKPPCSFEWYMYHRCPLRPPLRALPPNGGPKYTHEEQIRDLCCHLANTIEDSY